MLPLFLLRKSGPDASAGRLHGRPGRRSRHVPLRHRLLPLPAQWTTAKRAVTRLLPNILPISRTLPQVDVRPKYSIETVHISVVSDLHAAKSLATSQPRLTLPLPMASFLTQPLCICAQPNTKELPRLPLLGCLSWSLASSLGLDIGMSRS